ncbi:hypothetical protein F4U94_22645 [Sphingobium limneticum]|uniref:hypothetical protein n=1 Tax=Sphingobium limneticum TaxID=1007511 RepID=UPI00123CECE2|nr:hypothetical protein [Sphingobium limneticum]KAA9010776.1 hypothetical protein F4U94_22645 [Sphingobium limneticum]
MRKLSKLAIASAAMFAFTVPQVTNAQGLFGGLPRIAIGKSGAIIGSDSSSLGIGILTPGSNGTLNSVRILGGDKLLGLNLYDPISDELYDLQLNSPYDTDLQALLFD